MGDAARDYSWVKGVILDLDGTLYSQRKLRARMLIELLWAALLNGPQAVRVVRTFRHIREELSDAGALNAAELQYRLVAERLGISIDAVKSHIADWIYQRPLRHLSGARYPGVVEFVRFLRGQGVKVAVFSDHPVEEKLEALGIVPDVVYFALQEPGGYLKPSPHGLRRVVEKLALSPEECVLIGDRVDRDGACAAALGMHFLLCNKSNLFIELAKSQWRGTERPW